LVISEIVPPEILPFYAEFPSGGHITGLFDKSNLSTWHVIGPMEQAGMRMISAVCAAIIEWDLCNDAGQKLPLHPQVIYSLPYVITTTLYGAIMQSANSTVILVDASQEN
jgi:hypothetical protein